MQRQGDSILLWRHACALVGRHQGESAGREGTVFRGRRVILEKYSIFSLCCPVREKVGNFGARRYGG